MRWLLTGAVVAACWGCAPEPDFSGADLDTLASLQLSRLEPPADPSNRVLADPRAVELGRRLFFDERMSGNGAVACATCHRPDYAFADPRPLSRGMATTRRHAPSLLGAAYADWFYWDGRRDSLWAQALTPIEHPDEQGLERRAALAIVSEDAPTAELYRALFGPLPATGTDSDADADAITRAFVRIGKALAAYVATLLPQPGPFDHYVAALLAGESTSGMLTPDQVAGLRLFIGRADCVSCHNGPLFSNFSFHNVGTALGGPGDRTLDRGRWQGVREALADPFNCLGAFSDAAPETCSIRYARRNGAALDGAFKVPGLRNVARTPPYLHDGRLQTLEQVVAHYVAADPAGRLGHLEISPLPLTAAEQQSLVAFLQALSGE